MDQRCPACGSSDLLWRVARAGPDGGALAGECLACGCVLDERPFGPEGPPPGSVPASPGCAAGTPPATRH